MSLFSGMGETKISKGGVYFLPGIYKVEVQKVTTNRSAKGRKDFFIVESKILESDNPERKPGMLVSHVIDIGNVMGPANIKAFLAAANGIDPRNDEEVQAALGVGRDGTDHGEQAALFAVSEANPLAGTILKLVCTEITTKAGNPFTKHEYFPIEGEGEEVPF